MEKPHGVIGKSIMDITKFDTVNTNYSAHKIIAQCARHAWGDKDDVFYVLHYHGSFESAIRPNDRRGVEKVRDRWLENANKTVGEEKIGDVSPWLQGFVSHFGEEASHYLLDGITGFPYNASTALRVLDA